MAHENLRVQVGGAEVEQLYEDLLLAEVDLDDELAGTCRLSVALLLRPDGRWDYLDDERFAPWQPITVAAGVAEETQELFSGYITHLRPEFGEGLDRCRLEILAMDASVLMDRDDVLKDWPNKKDSDIARETFQAHDLEPDVTDTEVVHDEEVSTIIQRETDMQFLQRLAVRNGFECYVDGTRGYFGPPAASEGDQPVLAVAFGDETNVTRFALEVDALTPSAVAMSQVDRLSGEVLDARAESGLQPPLGARPLAAYLSSGMSPGVVQVGRAVTTGTAEMAVLCQALYDRAEHFVTGEGELDSHRYGAVLRPRSTVVVKGVGRTHSGSYLVTRVRHAFTAEGYTQTFGVKRNALEPTGAEDFAGAGDGLLGALA
ncbi:MULTISPECIES: phage late control D family protein [unclassified Geodermatophilus]|uniref:phage late control D family protein n=1 Tax=unclassified Geodermatophilus TaxID=2637632 RepID=UPI003EEF405E